MTTANRQSATYPVPLERFIWPPYRRKNLASRFEEFAAERALAVGNERMAVYVWEADAVKGLLRGSAFLERGCPHPNTLTIPLPSVFIEFRPTGPTGAAKDLATQTASDRLLKGVHQATRVEFAAASRHAGRSVSRSGARTYAG